jgi:hypothetical protein
VYHSSRGDYHGPTVKYCYTDRYIHYLTTIVILSVVYIRVSSRRRYGGRYVAGEGRDDASEEERKAKATELGECV